MALNKEQKAKVIEVLKDKFSNYSNFYLTDTESLSVDQFYKLRKACHDKNVEMRVAKNTLISKALESFNDEKYSGAIDALKGVTALMFSDSPKEPAVIISAFRKKNPGDRPILKAALIGEDLFVGDDQLVNLTKIKTKDELVGEVIGLLLSPIQRVVSALQNKDNATPSTEEAAPVAEAVAEVAPAAEAPVAEAPKADETPAAE